MPLNITLNYIHVIKMCTTVHVKTHLEGCNNTHPQTGDHPAHKSGFIDT